MATTEQPPRPAVDVIALAPTLQALSDATRLRALTASYHGPVSAPSLVRDLGIGTPLAAYNLRVLKNHGLVRHSHDVPATRGQNVQRFYVASMTGREWCRTLGLA